MTDWSVIVNIELDDRLHIGVTGFGFGDQILDESDDDGTQQGALLFKWLSTVDRPRRATLSHATMMSQATMLATTIKNYRACLLWRARRLPRQLRFGPCFPPPAIFDCRLENRHTERVGV